MSNCFERAVAFVPVLGVMRHVCSLHTQARSEAPSQRFPLERVIAVVRSLEFFEQNPDDAAYQDALADYREIAAIAPVTLARALEFVMSDLPARVESETRDLEKPF